MGWSTPASQRRNLLKKSFADDLNGIAESLANHIEVPVAETHVNQAFQALSNAGLYRRRWIDRPEAEMSLGTFFMGLAFACPDAIGVLFAEESRAGVAAGLFTFFLLFGVVLFGHAAWRARLPAPPPEKGSWLIVIYRSATVLLISFALFAGGFYAYRRFSGCCMIPQPESKAGDSQPPDAATPNNLSPEQPTAMRTEKSVIAPSSNNAPVN